MKVIKSISILQNTIKKYKREGKIIGFVPTMGALHDGHLSLIKRSLKKTDITVVSIFVNPTQFGPNEDFNRYPRPIKKDMGLLKKLNTDILFLPNNEIMYKDPLTTVSVKNITNILCGKYRPGHFDGVCLVVNKLFNIIMPDYAFFGEKDFQQLIVIKKMVFDLNMSVKVIGCPIIREKDGLAMSSRNMYLNKEERKSASQINKILKYGKSEIEKGKSISLIKNSMKKQLKKLKYRKLEYLEILDEKTLSKINNKSKKARIFVAIYIGKTRLIDNMGVKII